MVTLFHIRWKRLELFSSVICMSPWLSKLLRFRLNLYKRINVCNSHYRLQSNVAVANIWWFSLWVWIFTSVFFIVTFFLNLLHTRNVSLDCHSVVIDAHRVSWLQPWSATMKCNHDGSLTEAPFRIQITETDGWIWYQNSLQKNTAKYVVS